LLHASMCKLGFLDGLKRTHQLSHF
jgi:hypothetical protein